MAARATVPAFADIGAGTRLHKWIGLIVGLQVLGWVLGGLVMSAIPIAQVRSEHRLAAFQPDPLPASGLKDLGAASRAAGIAPAEATLKSTLRGPMWVLQDAAGARAVIDARTGRPPAPLTGAEARLLAGIAYTGPGRPAAGRFHDEAPQEAGRAGPVWSVDFDDPEGTRFYLDPETAEVVARRSDVWRVYDIFWRIHILDFRSGENFNHPLLIAAAALALALTATGLVLLVVRITRDLALLRRRRAGRATVSP